MIHLGDCRDFYGKISGDVLITDPPYNIGFSKYNEYGDNLGANEYIEMISGLKNFAPVMCVIQYPEETIRYIVPALGAPDFVMAWCYNSNTARRFRLISIYGAKPNMSRERQPFKNPDDARVSEAMKLGADGTALYEWFDDIQQVKNVSEEKTDHPCPIPLKLAKRLINLLSDEGQTIVDPFSGSGTVGLAAIQMKRKFVGCEKNQEYKSIADGRMSVELSQMKMF